MNMEGFSSSEQTDKIKIEQLSAELIKILDQLPMQNVKEIAQNLNLQEAIKLEEIANAYRARPGTFNRDGKLNPSPDKA